MLLLDHLYASAAQADAIAAPLLRRLFMATWQPYAERLEGWLFTPDMLPCSSPFMAPAPADIQALLPEPVAPEPWVSPPWDLVDRFHRHHTEAERCS